MRAHASALENKRSSFLSVAPEGSGAINPPGVKLRGTSTRGEGNAGIGANAMPTCSVPLQDLAAAWPQLLWGFVWPACC